MKEDMKDLMQDHYIKYASYVILDRAIPNIVDGLKPVQRRILYTLWMMDDGKLHKVANVAGQTMALHPHGDAAIIDALVNLANKDYLLDRQGNFGNLLTGDPAAAARYIETRLTSLAKETLFNKDLTSFTPSYDGRKEEPVLMPAKLPFLLIQGAEGIAVGMATHILPHNFKEVLEAEIAILEERPWTLVPDFLTGGVMDASEYDKGRGKVKLRAKVESVDPKTIVIREICHGTTTESLIRSIDEAAKKGKIKIDGISDYTAEKTEIEIKLPRGVYANDVIEALYAYTECEISLSSQIVVIKDEFPIETSVDFLLQHHAEQLQTLLRKELEIESLRLNEKIFERTLEQIFIDNKLYKPLENLAEYEAIHQSIESGLKPFLKELSRIPTHEDRETLLNIPIRRISKFDRQKNETEILSYHKELERVEKELKNIKKVAIRYLEDLLKKYGKKYPRNTAIQEIERIDTRAIETKKIKVAFDQDSQFIGTKVTGDTQIECTNFDKLLLLFSDGTYQVISIPEKLYLNLEGKKLIHLGAADKKTVFSAVYSDPKAKIAYGKRFVVEKFILDKIYRFFEEKTRLELLSTDPKTVVHLEFIPKPKQKVKEQTFDLHSIGIKGVTAKGVRLSPREFKTIKKVNGD